MKRRVCLSVVVDSPLSDLALGDGLQLTLSRYGGVDEIAVVDVRPVEGIQFGESEQDFAFRVLDEFVAELLEERRAAAGDDHEGVM